MLSVIRCLDSHPGYPHGIGIGIGAIHHHEAVSSSVSDGDSASCVPPPLMSDPCWDPATVISCALYASAHLMAHKTFAVAFARRKGVSLLVDIATRTQMVSANEVASHPPTFGISLLLYQSSRGCMCAIASRCRSTAAVLM